MKNKLLELGLPENLVDEILESFGVYQQARDIFMPLDETGYGISSFSLGMHGAPDERIFADITALNSACFSIQKGYDKIKPTGNNNDLVYFYISPKSLNSYSNLTAGR